MYAASQEGKPSHAAAITPPARPRVVELARAVHELVVLPDPGQPDLGTCHQWLSTAAGVTVEPRDVSSAAVFQVWSELSSRGEVDDVVVAATQQALSERLDVLGGTLKALREVVRRACKARGHHIDTMIPLEAASMSLPKLLSLDSRRLAALSFVAQLEALANCRNSRQLRQRYVAGVSTDKVALVRCTVTCPPPARSTQVSATFEVVSGGQQLKPSTYACAPPLS